MTMACANTIEYFLEPAPSASRPTSGRAIRGRRTPKIPPQEHIGGLPLTENLPADHFKTQKVLPEIGVWKGVENEIRVERRHQTDQKVHQYRPFSESKAVDPTWIQRNCFPTNSIPEHLALPEPPHFTATDLTLIQRNGFPTSIHPEDLALPERLYSNTADPTCMKRNGFPTNSLPELPPLPQRPYSNQPNQQATQYHPFPATVDGPAYGQGNAFPIHNQHCQPVEHPTFPTTTIGGGLTNGQGWDYPSINNELNHPIQPFHASPDTAVPTLHQDYYNAPVHYQPSTSGQYNTTEQTEDTQRPEEKYILGGLGDSGYNPYNIIW